MEGLNMKKIKWAQSIFAGILAVVWLFYAIANIVAQAPSFDVDVLRGWDFDSRLENIKQTANGSFYHHDIFQNLNGYKNQLTFSEMIPMDSSLSIIRGDGGYLYYSNNFPYENYEYSHQALQLREVQRATVEKGGSLLFVNCTDLYIDGLSESDLPLSNLNARSDALLYALQGYGVSSMDTRRVLAESDLLPSQYRYKTEPHWTTQAGFEVYFALLGWMEQQGGKAKDLAFFADRNNYKQTVYENAFSGQFGKRVGIPYAGYDNFTLIEPAFDTGFTLSYQKTSHLPPKQGEFASVLLEKRWMDQSNPYECNMYNTYLTSLYSYRQISNTLRPDGPKILVIGDAHMLPVVSFLGTAASEICLLWPYSTPDVEGVENLLDYIDTNTFDYVIIGMSPGSMYAGGFNFLDGVDVPELSE